jgi:hypothetical protein
MIIGGRRRSMHLEITTTADANSEREAKKERDPEDHVQTTNIIAAFGTTRIRWAAQPP